ncbi:MAG TPA: hypothetical protein VFN09_03885, partial [Rhodanobacteraceae bacterium]|nr:hypothetical protein [Rhodanobacteraceae bacterium]
LRTEAARAAYDAHCAGDAPPVAADHAPVAAAATGWKAVPVARPPSPHRFLRRATLAAGFMACCGLFYLALTRQDHPRTVALGAALPGEATTDTRVPATVASIPRRESTGNELAAGNVLRADTPAVALAPAGQMAPLSSDAVPASASIPLPAAPLAVAEPRLAQAAPVTPAPVESPAVPLPASRRQRAITHRSRPAAPAAVEPALTAQADSSRHAGASGNTVSAQAVNQTPVIAPAEVPEAASELATTKDEVPLPLMPASVGEPVAERAATTKKVAPAELLTRMSLARQRVRDLVRFFRRQDRGDLGGPDAQGADSAQHSRHALRQRIGVAAAAHFALDPPTWQVSAEQAVLDADYRVARRSRVAERGRFRVDMVWDDNQWRLTRVALEPER